MRVPENASELETRRGDMPVCNNLLFHLTAEALN